MEAAAAPSAGHDERPDGTHFANDDMTDTTSAVAAADADGPDIPSRPRTIAELPFFASGRFPKPDLMGQCRDGGVVYTSGRDLLPRVRDISLGLSSLGMTAGDRVAILAESRPEWLLADLAVLAAGAVTAPIYPTLSADQVAFILGDCEASMAVVSSPPLPAPTRGSRSTRVGSSVSR